MYCQPLFDIYQVEFNYLRTTIVRRPLITSRAQASNTKPGEEGKEERKIQG
jgi:hypothetical protein